MIAQGIEAGGHAAGEVSTMVLLPRIVDAVAPALVLAAGGSPTQEFNGSPVRLRTSMQLETLSR